MVKIFAYFSFRQPPWVCIQSYFQISINKYYTIIKDTEEFQHVQNSIQLSSQCSSKKYYFCVMPLYIWIEAPFLAQYAVSSP